MSGAARDPSWAAALSSDRDRRQAANLLRSLEPLTPVDNLHALDTHGRSLTLFSTNDYLGLADHPDVLAAWRAATPGAGPRASSLVAGHTVFHEALVSDLCTWQRAQSGLLFPTGYAANIAAMQALATEGVDVYSDSLNHASLIDGLRLARRQGARVHVYPHANMDALEAGLQQAKGRRLIVTDGVFSMDGDIAPLANICALRDRYDALVVVDDAHGCLVLGDEGRGSAAACGVHDRVDVHVGTLSKAIASQGGFVVGDRDVVDAILQAGRPGIYSTALPIPTIAAARAALAVGRAADDRREHLRRLVALVPGPAVADHSTPILPWIVGDEATALRLAAALREEGFHVVAIRPPTVAPGTSRLRLSLSAGHREDEVNALAQALQRLAGG